MADIKISALTDGGEALATDDVLVVRAGANRRVRPPVPFGPYATLAALIAAKPPTTALTGRLGYYGSAAPYSFARCDGASWVDGAGNSSPSERVAVTASRALTAADHGKILEIQAGGLTLSTASGALPTTFFCVYNLLTGTTSFTFTGGATCNGAATTITRAASANWFSPFAPPISPVVPR